MFKPVTTIAGITEPKDLIDKRVRFDVHGHGHLRDGRVKDVDPRNTAHVLVSDGHNTWTCHWLTLHARPEDFTSDYQYDAKTDAIIYKHATDFDQGDFARCAMAMLDQAGADLGTQKRIQEILAQAGIL